jgi:type I restriction enzyme S subunit
MNEWGLFSISELGEIVTGTTPSTKNNLFWSGDIPFYTPGDITESSFCGSTEKHISKDALAIGRPIPKNSILVTCIGSTIGKVTINSIEGLTNQQINAIIPTSKFDNVFTYYVIAFHSDLIKRIAPQTAVPIINKTEFGKIKVRFPAPAVQKKIARILSTADAIIEKTQAAITKYKSIKQGMLHDLFTRGIDVKTGKLRPRYEDAPELYKESKLGWIPKEWKVDSLGTICEINPLANLPANLGLNDEVSFLRMEDVSNDAGILNTHTKKLKDLLKKGFTPFRNNDILFAKITPCMENGKGALAINLKNELGFGSTEFHVLRPLNERTILFLFYLTTSVEFRLEAEGKMSGSAGQQRVPASFFTEYKIALAPMDEQLAIGLRIDLINTEIQTEQIYLYKMQRLKQGLMADLLSGKKKVSNLLTI